MDRDACGCIGVLMGGPSSERDISLKSGNAVLSALKEKGCRVEGIVIDSTDEEALFDALKAAAVDMAFIALHGAFGEDGTVQAMLESRQFPYTGSDALASRLAMDKVATQALMKVHGINVPPYRVLERGQPANFQELADSMRTARLVVKPSSQGSSIGIGMAASQEEFAAALQAAFVLDERVLVEAYIPGREITAGILGREALPLVEIRPKHAFFDFTAKYQAGLSEYLVPAELAPGLAERVQSMAIKAYQLIGCRDFARMDFILALHNEPFFLEANTIPGFTATSLLPKAARQAGYEFGDLCLRIISMAQERQKNSSLRY